MPLHYMLLFPNGDASRHFGLQLQANANTARKQLRMSAQMYYHYLLYNQSTEWDPNIIHLAGCLFQQFIIDTYSVVELERLEFL